LWLVAAIGLLVGERNRRQLVRRTATPLLCIYTAFAGVALLEVMSRLTGHPTPVPGLRQPGIKAVTRYKASDGPGMGGVKHYTINELGLRGPMPPAHGKVYKIVAIGGSTTICSELDDSEEWPHVLMEDLNRPVTAVPAWVGNAGVSGFNSVNHIVLMQWLPGIVRFDAAVFLIGVNDFSVVLHSDGAPTETMLRAEAGFQGDLPPGTLWRTREVYPYYRRLTLFQAFRDAESNVKARFAPTPTLPFADLEPLRKRRAESPVIPLPDLSVGLREYRGRVETLIRQCQDLRLRCLFLTQPTMWRAGLSSSEEALLWLGYVGRWDRPKGYVSARDLERGMDLYNQTLLDVCRETRAECLDLARLVPKDTTAFFDDMHYNPSGSRFVAAALANYLGSSLK
jgi:hypothetical protein